MSAAKRTRRQKGTTIVKHWTSGAEAVEELEALLATRRRYGMKNEGDFVAGAIAALHIAYQTAEEEEENKLSAVIPPRWVFAVMGGRSILDLDKETDT